MTAFSPLEDESFSHDVVLYVDGVCDRFEEALRREQQPEIEHYLAGAAPQARAMLLHELIALELAYGRAAPLPAYRRRFPHDIELVRQVFHAADQAVAACGDRPAKRQRRWLFSGVFLAVSGGALLLLATLGWTLWPHSTRDEPLGRHFTNSLGMEFALIPAGRFQMGSPVDEALRNDDEGPVHEVQITRPFFLGIHEVTVGQFRAFVENSGYRTEAEASGEGALREYPASRRFDPDPQCNWRNPGWPQADSDPVVCVTWNDAQAFCAWLSGQEGRAYRLPTEAEWEYACRGGTTTPFSTGPTLTSAGANFNGNRLAGTELVPGPYLARPVAVGSYPPNSFGLCEMHGNVAEWCADYYAPEYPQGPSIDPTGPTQGQFRVFRGGSWREGDDRCRCASRCDGLPECAITVVGFRVACAPRP
jgi:formylglycine-generating enzyme required for sulfatase activity